MRRFSKKLIPLCLGLIVFGLFAFAAPTFAQETEPVIDQTAFESFAEEAGFAPSVDIRVVVARLIRTVLTLLGIILLGYLIYGGFLWMTSQGDTTKIDKARKTIINAVIGVAIVLSSWAITTFVINTLVTAVTGVEGGESEYDGGNCPPFCGSEYYDDLVVESFGCAVGDLPNKNIVVSILFNQDVDEDSVDGNVSVRVFQGDAVEGTYEVDDDVITFTPSAVCDEDPIEFCFEENTTYEVLIGNGLMSTDEDMIDCSQGEGCDSEFTTGELVDTEDPEVIMTDPDDGDNIEVYEPTMLQAIGADDGGINLLRFYVDGSYEDSGEEVMEGIFTGLWDSPELGERTLYARAWDCSNNRGQSDSIEVDVQYAHCFNGNYEEDDPSFPDEDETGLDCGGADCDNCPEDVCEQDDDCQGGYCLDGECVGYPEIDSVSPTSGAPGNYVTITGEYFGETEGTVEFLGTDTDGDGDEEGDDDDVVAPLADCTVAWGDEQVIIEVPDAGVDGPLKLTVADPGDGNEPLSDRTDDDNGTLIEPFEITDVVAPGICSVDPSEGLSGILVELLGVNFGQLTSTVYFSRLGIGYEASEYDDWDDENISCRVPVLNAGDHGVQVFVDGVGSNEVEFTALIEEEDEEPVISYIDSGLSACLDRASLTCSEESDCSGTCEQGFPTSCSNDPSFTGCVTDDECNFGSCESAGDTGSEGQYVTVYGSNLGNSEGFVWFVDQDGKEVYGESTFPDACSGGTWDDEQVIVKVPDIDDLFLDTIHDVYIERYDSAVSNEVDFEVTDGEPGPGVCLLDPDSGPVDLDVDIYGEYFGALTGAVEFWEETEAIVISGDWSDEEINTSVPEDAATGPVQITDQDDNVSNTLNFTVGDCNEIPGMCGEGDTCCEDGSCRDECPSLIIPESMYLWKFATGPIPVAPTVVSECSENYISPTPYTLWDGGEEACVNSRIAASFLDQDDGGVNVDMTTLNDNTILVQECIDVGDDPCDELADPLEGDIDTATQNVFYFDLSPVGSRYETDTWYQVTLVGGEGGIEGDTGAVMVEDYVWTFKTRIDSEDCDIEDVYVQPYEETLTSRGDEETFSASPIGDFACQLLIDEGLNWNWTAVYNGPTHVSHLIDMIANDDQLIDPEDAQVFAQAETESGYIIDMIAQLIDLGLDDEADLIIDFGEPMVTDYAPDCTEACTNAAIVAEFSEEMSPSSFGNNVDVFTCFDDLCEVGLSTFTFESLEFNPDNTEVTIEHSGLTASTSYRVVIEGDDPLTIGEVEGVTSRSGVGMIGLNYGTAFSWTFKTKADATPCGIERVVMDPQEAIMSYIGERQAYQAQPFGAPDECSVSGQQLTGHDYPWAWSINDVEGVQQDWIIAEFDPVDLNTTPELPQGCSSVCLNTGSEPGLSICGENGIEFGEDCDDGGAADDDGCSASCLLEGFLGIEVGGVCGNASLDIVNGYEEECDNGGLCSDNSTICTSNAECVGISGGYCEDETTFCEDDAGCADIGGLCGDDLTFCEIDDDCLGIDDELCNLYGTTCDLNPEVCSPRSGDGCSSECLNEGSDNANVVCGDGVTNHDPTIGGEECDDGNTRSGDGCSSLCLNEGSDDVTIVFAVCGNGTQEDGEDCDDGNEDDNDQCNSSCLTEEFIDDDFGGTCGDGVIDSVNGVNEECDDGGNVNGDGCSAGCLLEGSSYLYDNPSFCGDGNLENDAGEECDADAQDVDTNIDPLQIVQITADAAQAVLDLENNEVTTDLFAAGTDDYGNTETGSAIVGINCSCEADSDCGDVNVYGCGAAACCFERPADPTFSPDATAGACRNALVAVEFADQMDHGLLTDNIIFVYLGDDNDQDGVVDDPTALVECPDGYTQYPELAPTTMHDRPWYARAWHWAKQKVLGLFGGQNALANDIEACIMDGSLDVRTVEGGGTTVTFQYTQALETNGAYALVVAADSDATDDNDLATYNVGVLSDDLVSLPGIGEALYGFDDVHYSEFSTGGDICSLNHVSVTDISESPGLYTYSGESHDFVAIAKTRRAGGILEPISQIEAYNWSWEWDTSIPVPAEAEDPSDILVENDPYNPPAYTAVETAGEAIEGTEYVIATAEIQNDIVLDPPSFHCSINFLEPCSVDADCPNNLDLGETCIGDAVSGQVQEDVMLCENPWPGVGHFPFEDTEEGDLDFAEAVNEGLVLEDFGPSVYDTPADPFPYTNFSTYYCRDAGEADNLDDDLPALRVVEAPAPVSPNVFRELLLIVQGEGYSDAVGVRVASNENYNTPTEWFADQGFVGAPVEESLDGYEGVRDGGTLYVNAANQTGDIYPNIYAVALNEGADDETAEIYDQLLENWSFNENSYFDGDTYVNVIDDIELCYRNSLMQSLLYDTVSCSEDSDCQPHGESAVCDSGFCYEDEDLGVQVTEVVTCESDYDCANETYPVAVCGNSKTKLQHDLVRLTNFRDMIDAIEGYGNTNRRCSVTTGESCLVDDNCPGDETCVDTVPELDVGTFLRSRSFSPWPSWQAQLANALGVSMPSDPIDTFVDCPEGYDETTCWNGLESQFICYEDSHTYGYRSIGGEAYELFGTLEYSGAPWAYPIDEDENDWATITLYGAFDDGDYSDGFNPDTFCASEDDGGTVLGNSGECGDGVIGQSESCEIGDSMARSCAAGTVYICINNDEPSYNGLSCDQAGDIAEQCGPSGTCENQYDGNYIEGSISAACCDGVNCSVSLTGACVDYQAQLDAEAEGGECIPATCGNGVVDAAWEECDDGAFNGIYGYCGEDCNYDGAIFCGDGALAGSEICDCGYNEEFRLAGAWAVLAGNCDSVNGLYSLNPDLGCAFDCSGPPAHCGDAIVNGNEICDSESESWAGALCDDSRRDPCESDDDCDEGVTCGSAAFGNEACASSSVCLGGSVPGKPCDIANNDNDCPNDGDDQGTCSANIFDLTRNRQCRSNVDYLSACTWRDWDDIGGYECISENYCGDGEVNGDEACDDGNDSNNDECTTDCEYNVCGDGRLYIGQESCDSGEENGEQCEAPYDGTCNYCSETCIYETVSGGYCGDGTVNGNEVCDGAETPTMYCYDGGIDPEERDIAGSCDDDSDCAEYGVDYYCEAAVGYCDGGYYNDGYNEYDYNANPCLTETENSYAIGGYNCSGDGLFGVGGECITQRCDDSCSYSCPFITEEVAVLIQGNEEGSQPGDSLDLYSYLSGETPDNAELTFPSCRVGLSMTADVSFEDVEDPYVDVVFLVDKSGSMRNDMAGEWTCEYENICTAGDDDEINTSCTDDADCGAGGVCSDNSDCVSRMEVAKAGVAESIVDLFDGFESGKMKIGLASFETCGDEAVDQDLVDDNDLGALLTELNAYSDYPYGGTATASGLDLVVDVFSGSTAEDKILVLLSDGAPNQDLSCAEDSDSALDDAIDRTDALKDIGVTIYTAAILTSDQDTRIGKMAHLSSEDCGNDYENREDCISPTGTPYAYVAETEDEFDDMMDAVIDAIRGASVTYTTQIDNATLTSGGTVQEGADVDLPFPTGFECQGEEFIVPFRVEFSGTGPIGIENIYLDYCPL